jgi:hypothetical protein
MMAYVLDGDLLEVCTCNVLCPCWIGEDPDGGTCDSSLAYRFRSGQIDGVDVSGVVAAGVVRIPGNVLAGNWRRQLYIDSGASDEQAEAVAAVLTGKKGGPMADLAALIGEELPIRRAPITFDLEEGRGRLVVGDVVEAAMEPYRGPTGEVTTLRESIFSTIPGSPAFVAKAERFRMTEPVLGVDLDIAGHNAIQGVLHFEYHGETEPA